MALTATCKLISARFFIKVKSLFTCFNEAVTMEMTWPPCYVYTLSSVSDLCCKIQHIAHLILLVLHF